MCVCLWWNLFPSLCKLVHHFAAIRALWAERDAHFRVCRCVLWFVRFFPEDRDDRCPTFNKSMCMCVCVGVCVSLSFTTQKNNNNTHYHHHMAIWYSIILVFILFYFLSFSLSLSLSLSLLLALFFFPLICFILSLTLPSQPALSHIRDMCENDCFMWFQYSHI